MDMIYTEKSLMIIFRIEKITMLRSPTETMYLIFFQYMSHACHLDVSITVARYKRSDEFRRPPKVR